MILDELPIRWGFIFEVTIIAGILLTAAQIKIADVLDAKRFNSEARGALFQARRGIRWIKGLVLCWLAVYAYGHQWQPWPPMVAFIVVFDVWLLLDVLVMRKDNLRQGTL